MINQENLPKQIPFKETISWLWKFWGDLKFTLFFLIIITPITMWLNLIAQSLLVIYLMN